MTLDFETNNFVGAGEAATFNILKYLTNLEYRSLKEFRIRSGIYKQVPITWLLPVKVMENLSQSHLRGSIDLMIMFDSRKIAIRVQGKGHGEILKGLGKARHDQVQYDLLKNYCDVVDVKIQECPNVFKDLVSQKAIQEIIDSFKTAGVMIPVL